jgi:DNA-directed RNA polymerase specialized sigma24 family protein
MNELEMNRYIAHHDETIRRGIRQLKKALHEIGRRYSQDDMDDAAQELRIVMFKCLKNFKPWYKNTLETYISSSIQKNANGMIRTQCKPKHTTTYYSASLSSPTETEGGYEELINTIADDKLPSEPRLDAVIFSESLLSMLDPVSRARICAWLEGVPVVEIAFREGVSRQMEQFYIDRGIDSLRKIVDNQEQGGI